MGRQIPGELTLPRKLSPENLLWVFWACEISSTFDLSHDWISSGIKVTRKNEGSPEDFLVLLWWLLPGELQCPVCWPILFIHKLVTSAFSGVHSPFPHFPTYNFLFFTYCQLLQHLTNMSELCFVVKWFYCFENSNVVGLKKKKSNVIFTVVCFCANKVRLCELGLVSVSSLPNANWAELRCCLWECWSDLRIKGQKYQPAWGGDAGTFYIIRFAQLVLCLTLNVKQEMENRRWECLLPLR